MGRGDHLGELEALVLTVVVRLTAGGDGAHGTGIYDELESLTGRDPTVPGVHVTLRRLEDKGLVASETGEPSPRGGRPRRYYHATPEGLRALALFRSMWEGLFDGLDLPGRGAAS